MAQPMITRLNKKAITEFLLEEDGTTSVEYAVMLALIITVCISSVQFLTSQTEQSFNDAGAAISGAFN